MRASVLATSRRRKVPDRNRFQPRINDGARDLTEITAGSLRD
jgi:hypothetical protein